MNNRVRLVPATNRHVGRIANRMREMDVRECAALGKTPKQALRQGVQLSTIAWTALVDNQPEAMFGVVIDSVLDRKGTPWFLGTDEVYRHGRELLMWGGALVSRLQQDSNLTLSNIVCSENVAAIRLLPKWGFVVDEEEHEVGGEMFRAFRREPT